MIDPIDVILAAQSRGLVEIPPAFFSADLTRRRAMAAELENEVCRNVTTSAHEQFVAHLVRRGYRVPERKPRPPATPVQLRNVAVACCYFNPARFRNRHRNYQRFAWASKRQGVPFYTVELVLDDDEPALAGDQVVHVRGTRRHNSLWQKERLLNLLVGKLPADVDAVVCADVDLIWLEDDWLEKTRVALEAVPVVQPFRRMRKFDAAGVGLVECTSVGHAVNHRLPFQHPWLACPGYAWAARRSFWERCGWFDLMITGSGDCSFVAALLGDEIPERYAPRLTPAPPAIAEARRQWAARVYREVRGNVGCIDVDAAHCWHGDERDRGYTERHTVLARYGFHLRDLVIDAAGLWAWRDPDSKLARAMGEFFATRKEDGR